MRFRRTTLIGIACASVLAGLGISRKISLEPEWWLLVFLPALVLLKNKTLASLVLVIIFGVGIGMWRGGLYMNKLAELSVLDYQKVTLEATATADAVYGAKSQIEFTASSLSVVAPKREALAGNAKISGFGVPMVYRGDRVEVTGKLY